MSTYLRIFGLLVTFLVAGCSTTGLESSRPDDGTATVRVASYDFTENQVLAELYAQGLRRAGVAVEIQHGLGTREVVEPALEQGHIDFVVDYLGTALDFLEPGTMLSHGTAEAVHAELTTRFAERGVAVLPFAVAEDQNGFAVTDAFARDNDVSRLSDLVGKSTDLVLGGPPECQARRYCGKGLESVYGLTFNSFREMPTRAATAAALTTGEIDVGLLETTDPRLSGGEFVLLEDDRGLQPRENVVPLVRQTVLDAQPRALADAVDQVTGGLTTPQLIELNRAVELDGLTPAAAASAWLDQQSPRAPANAS